MNGLLSKLNAQLKQHDVGIQKSVAIIDASITRTAQQPRGKSTNLPADKLDDATIQQTKSGVDLEARWGKKRDKLQYGSAVSWQVYQFTCKQA